jgi:hypothetical protein
MSPYGLIVFSPDATVLGLHRIAIARLQSVGIEVSLFRWGVIGPQQTARLYQHNRLKMPRPTLDELVDRLFAIGPSLVCRVCTQSGDIFEKLTALKGPSRPSRCASHHLRRQLGAENAILNRLHTSDSQSSAELEAEALSDALQSSQNGAEPGMAMDERESTSAAEVFCRLKLSLIREDPESEHIEGLASSEWVTAKKLVKSAEDYAVLSAYRDQQLCRLESRSSASVSTSAIRILCADQISLSDWKRVVALFEKTTPISRWDQLIVESELFSRANHYI